MDDTPKATFQVNVGNAPGQPSSTLSRLFIYTPEAHAKDVEDSSSSYGVLPFYEVLRRKAFSYAMDLADGKTAKWIEVTWTWRD